MPARKSIIINMATNMVKTLGLDVPVDSATGSVTQSWFYSFKNRHKDLFDFEQTRGLEAVRAKWLTAQNAAMHYRLLAEQFKRAHARAELKARSESVKSKAMVKALKELDVKALAVAAKLVDGKCDSDGSSSCTDSSNSDGDSDSGPLEKRLTSTFAWTKPATAKKNRKKLRKRKRQLDAEDARRKEKAEKGAKAARNVKRQRASEGQRILAELGRADDWLAKFKKLTVKKVRAVGVSLCMEKVPTQPKADVLAAVQPVLQEWMDARPATRADGADAGEQ